MAIWSLTKERVDKLLQQIGEKEEEVDAYLKLSPKDLWIKDLDDFIAEWRFQLEDEEKRAKNVARKGRRASTKLKLGGKAPALKKRKAGGDSDDSDFAAPSKKPGPAKRAQPKPESSLNFLKPARPALGKPETKPTAKVSLTSQPLPLDSASSQFSGSDAGLAPIFKKVRTAAASAKPSGLIELDDSISEIPETVKPSTRKPRAAATKPIRYDIGSEDSDDDNDDDMLGDVSKLVKGLGAPSNVAAGSRSLFSNSKSQPSSSTGFTKAKVAGNSAEADLSGDDDIKSRAKPSQNTMATRPVKGSVSSGEVDEIMDLAIADRESKVSGKEKAPKTSTQKKVVSKKTAGKSVVVDLSDDDDIPKITAKRPQSKAVPRAVEQSALSDIDDSMDVLVGTKPGTKGPKSKPPGKAPARNAPAVASKKLQLSPAAKAYAAKQSKRKIVQSEDDDDDADAIANDILGSPTGDKDVEMADFSPPPARARAASSRPARRAAAAVQRKPAYVDDSEEAESAEEDESDDFDDDDD
jgi:DNA topoisomerase II